MKSTKITRKKLIITLALITVTCLFTHFTFVLLRKNLPVSIFFNDLITDVFLGSDEKIQVDSKILIKTIKFMIEERDQYDDEVIEFVRTLIVPPSHKPWNLVNQKRVDFSQSGQSQMVDQLLNKQRKGFFIEAGGFDGESFSNTLFFERERNWTGIIIEPIPRYFAQILEKNRHAFALNMCIARSTPVVVRFQVDHVLSGRLKSMSKYFVDRLQEDSLIKKFAYVPCYSINTILRALGVNKVEYFSLDVEGGEPDVIESIDFDNASFDVFTIECLGAKDPLKRERILKHMKSNGYNLKRDDGQDLIFVRNV